MGKISKALKKLSVKEQKNVKEILLNLKNNSLDVFDVKRLKGHSDIFRIRKGEIRIIYKMDKSDDIVILAIERRTDNTYKF